jgi:cell division GTPase FtsZ
MGDEAEIIWGTQIDPSLGEKIQVTTKLSGVTSPYNLKIDLEEDILEPLTDVLITHETPRITSIWE